LYYENGQIDLERNWKDGKKDSKTTNYYENGQIKKEKNYKDGKQDGLYTVWYENGQRSSVTTWKNDEIISGKCWDEDGNETDCY